MFVDWREFTLMAELAKLSSVTNFLKYVSDSALQKLSTVTRTGSDAAALNEKVDSNRIRARMNS